MNCKSDSCLSTHQRLEGGDPVGHQAIRWKTVFVSSVMLFALAACTSVPPTNPPSSSYDVFLLAGQSNMVGNGRGFDNAVDAAISPRVWQWDPNSGTIVAAQDPLFQNQSTLGGIGLGMTFAKAYLKTIAENRNVLLVGSAANNTTFLSGRWQAPNGDLSKAAVERANSAMTAAGPGARFAGILWLQGEGDINGGGASTYQASLYRLISYFRANISGASLKTPFVVGEMSHEWLASNLGNSKLAEAQSVVLSVFHTLPEKVQYTAWVSSGRLPGDTRSGIMHFSALSERELGRRYADKVFEATNNLPEPQFSQVAWPGLPENTGSPFPRVIAEDPQARGYLIYLARGISFHASFTKMAWFKSSGEEATPIPIPEPLIIQARLIEAGRSTSPSVVNIALQVNRCCNEWKNVALVYNAPAKTMSIYLNGTPTSFKDRIASASVPLLTGSQEVATRTDLDSEIAGNRAWNVALTPSQISAIYNYEVNHVANF
jgi:hypothetical protein